MIHALPYKTKQFFFLLIKLSIVIGAFYFIYQKLVNNENLNFNVFIDFLSKNDVFSLKNIGFLLILTFFNWFLEILKWQNLMIFIKNISFFDALKQSLASLTSSLFTPNRIGDYVAKAAYYSKSYRKRILLLNLISNMAQMSITVIFGIVGLALFITKYDFEISYFKVGRMGVILIVIFSLSIFGIKQDRIRIVCSFGNIVTNSIWCK